MRVYVAGARDTFEEVRRIQQLCHDCGHYITWDWTAARTDEEWKTGKDSTDAWTRQDNAYKDWEGVQSADLVIAVMSPKVFGTLIEIGMQLSKRKAVWLIGKSPRDSVFFDLPEMWHVTDEEEMLTKLRQM